MKRNLPEIDGIFERLAVLFNSGNVTRAEVVEILHKWMPSFEHIEKGRDCDSKM